jgi:hypothetical protein
MKFRLVVFLLMLFTNMHSQIIPGYIFGLNLSTIALKTNGINTRSEMPIGIHFGGYFEIPLNDNLALESGLLFSAKGSNFKIDTVAYSLSPIYIEVPVNTVLSFGSDEVKISLFGGPYFAWGVGGYKIESGGELERISFGSGRNNDLRTFDFGLNFGAAINLKGLLISAQYGIGLSNLSPVTLDGLEMKNRVIGISILSLFSYK